MLLVVGKTPDNFENSPFLRYIKNWGILLTVEPPFSNISDRELLIFFLTGELTKFDAISVATSKKMPLKGYYALAKTYLAERGKTGYILKKEVTPISTSERIGGRTVTLEPVANNFAIVKYDGGEELIQEKRGNEYLFVRAKSKTAKTGEKLLRTFQKRYLEKFGLFLRFLDFSKAKKLKFKIDGVFTTSDYLTKMNLQFIGLKYSSLRGVLSKKPNQLGVIHLPKLKSTNLTALLKRADFEPVVFIFRKTTWGSLLVAIAYEKLEESFSSPLSFTTLGKIFSFLKEREEEGNPSQP